MKFSLLPAPLYLNAIYIPAWCAACISDICCNNDAEALQRAAAANIAARATATAPTYSLGELTALQRQQQQQHRQGQGAGVGGGFGPVLDRPSPEGPIAGEGNFI